MLIQAIVAQSGGKLPAPLVAMIEAHFRRMGEDFARLAAQVEKGEVSSRQERRTGLSPNMAQKLPLPLWERTAERGHSARKREPQTLRTQPPPKTRDDLNTATGPPKFPAQRARALACPFCYDFKTLSGDGCAL